MSRNLQPTESHFERKDRFRFEEDYLKEEEALEAARTRSLKTPKVITVMQWTKTCMYTIQSHGVALIDTVVIAKYQRGKRLQITTLEGKHDKQLEKEEVEAFARLGIITEVQFERHRGRVCFVPENNGDMSKVKQIFLERWPDFVLTECTHTDEEALDEVHHPMPVYIYFKQKA